MGHLSNDVGKAFDGRLEAAMEIAQQTRVIEWFAHQQPAFTLSRKPVKQSGTDFVGVLRGGLMLAVESKSVKGDTLEFDLIVPDPTAKHPYGAFRQEQVAHLNGTQRAGGVALVAVEFRLEHSHHPFLIPWDELGRLWKPRVKRRTVKLDEIPDRWIMPHEGVIASRLLRCEGCGTYRALGPRRTNCCWGAKAPF